MNFINFHNIMYLVLGRFLFYVRCTVILYGHRSITLTNSIMYLVLGRFLFYVRCTVILYGRRSITLTNSLISLNL
jgi:cytochrome c oxidase assembly factor CtaG